MTTHGCLKISLRGERRSVLLHTVQGGQDGAILDVVNRAPAHHAEHRFGWITKAPVLARNLRDAGPVHLVDWLATNAGKDGLADPPSVAGWIIAARPNYLVPVPPAFVRDLPSWFGADAPCELILERHGLTWTFAPVEAEPVTIQPWRITVDAVADLLRSRPEVERERARCLAAVDAEDELADPMPESLHGVDPAELARSAVRVTKRNIRERIERG